MAPANPAIYKLDPDDRLQIPKVALPSWLQKPTEDGLFCVPIRWLRAADLLPGHELEAWCLWNGPVSTAWTIRPEEVLEHAARDASFYALKTLMYPAKYDAKGRISCAGIFNAMARESGRRDFWVAPELDSISIWTNAAFQWSYSRLTTP